MRDSAVPSLMCTLGVAMLMFPTAALAQDDAPTLTYEEQVRHELDLWAHVMEMHRVDYGAYPEAPSIDVAAAIAIREGYWHAPILRVPGGRPYVLISRSHGYRVATADGATSRSRDLAGPEQAARVVLPSRLPARTARLAPLIPPVSPDAVANTLLLTKSGADIVWTWGGSGTTADGASSADVQFRQVRTHFRGKPTPPYSYTWVNGITEDASTPLRFFDVSDEAEPGGNRGAPLPPASPRIDPNDPSTNLSGLYVGGAGVLIGENFSTVDNWICFEGGTCVRPTATTTTRLDYTVPPGAVSGKVYVISENQASNVETAKVRIESATILTRSIGFSDQDNSFWLGARDTTSTPVNSVYRLYYDTTTKLWARENRSASTEPSLVYYCSTQTGRDGWLVCGVGTTGYAGWYTRKIDTDAPGSLTDCMNIGTGGNVRGAAIDPNPAAVAGRDVAYFAHADTTTSCPVDGGFKIKKVQMSPVCGGYIDQQWGKDPVTGDPFCWNGLWGTQVGMAVDPLMGDLYVGSLGTIYKIDALTEVVTTVKTGFSGILGLDLVRDGDNVATNPGFLLIADNGVSTVYGLALDNTSVAPTNITSASILRTVAWGASVFSGDFDPTDPDQRIIRREVVYNDDTATGRQAPLRPHPFLLPAPSPTPLKLWVSSPDPNEPLPPGQAHRLVLKRQVR